MSIADETNVKLNFATDWKYAPAPETAKVEIKLGRPEEAAKRWRDVWAAGHGVGEVHATEPLAAIVDDLTRDYAAAAPTPIGP